MDKDQVLDNYKNLSRIVKRSSLSDRTIRPKMLRDKTITSGTKIALGLYDYEKLLERGGILYAENLDNDEAIKAL